jgi:hypothetical protein
MAVRYILDIHAKLVNVTPVEHAFASHLTMMNALYGKSSCSSELSQLQEDVCLTPPTIGCVSSYYYCELLRVQRETFHALWFGH